MKYLVLIGRLFYSCIFIASSIAHFSAQTINYAANQGVPLANIAVPLSGIFALIGGLSVATGYKTKIGVWLLVLFLIPVTLMMHAFWKVENPMEAQIQQAMFMKNVSMLGAAFLIAYFGSGPLSLGNKTNA